MNEIFISTSCLKQGKNLFYVLDKYLENGIRTVELGSSHNYENNLQDKLLNEYLKKAKFQIHGYFPPLKNPIVINLASQNKEILQKSIFHSKQAIDLTYKLGSSLYSIHAGIRKDPDPKELGKKFNTKNIADYNAAFDTFVSSLKEICKYAKQYNIEIAVENHVVAPFNLTNKENKLFLMSGHDEFIELFKNVKKRNLGILLDLGHLKVTSKTLGFDKNIFIDEIKEYIKVIHLHDNDGATDLHRNIKLGSWPFEIIKEKKIKDIPITLESHNLTIQEIIETKLFLEKEFM